MVLLGLTGGVAMGKSTAAAAFRCYDVPVFDADAAVHRLFAPKGAAVEAVAAAFPGSLLGDSGIDRAALGRMVFGDRAALKRLEAIVHPLVRAAERRFLGRCAARGLRLAVLDIPLLFETGGERRVDAVAVVSAPAFLQAQRALRRPGMDAARLEAVRARQTPAADTRRRADYVIPTGLGRRPMLDAVGAVVAELRRRPGGGAWPDRWLRAA